MAAAGPHRAARHVAGGAEAERPHGCEQSGKALAQKAGLVLHTRLRTGERPYGGKDFAPLPTSCRTGTSSQARGTSGALPAGGPPSRRRPSSST